MENLLIYGFGGFGREVACLINHINREEPRWNLLGFIDDGVDVGTECRYGKVIGGFQTLNNWPSCVNVAFAIANPIHLARISSELDNPLLRFPNLIAPNVFYFEENSLVIGCGNIITFGCRLGCNLKMGDFNLLIGMISLGHDVEIGSNNVFFPETRISGQTSIGNNNLFGSRSFVAQDLKVGDDNRIGAGCFVFRKIKDGGTYMGTPCKKISIE